MRFHPTALADSAQNGRWSEFFFSFATQSLYLLHQLDFLPFAFTMTKGLQSAIVRKSMLNRSLINDMQSAVIDMTAASKTLLLFATPQRSGEHCTSYFGPRLFYEPSFLSFRVMTLTALVDQYAHLCRSSIVYCNQWRCCYLSVEALSVTTALVQRCWIRRLVSWGRRVSQHVSIDLHPLHLQVQAITSKPIFNCLSLKRQSKEARISKR